MKKTVPMISMIFLFSFAGFVYANDNPEGQPFKALWEAITELQNRVENISLTPGPQGPSGPQGVRGEQGLQGIPGSRVLGLKKNMPYVSILFGYSQTKIIPGTKVCFDKKDPDSLVRITYQDILYASNPCLIQSVLDGAYLKGNEVGPDGGMGDYSPISLSWLEEAGMGAHCVELAVASASGGNCKFGASSTNVQANNFILVEELQR